MRAFKASEGAEKVDRRVYVHTKHGRKLWVEPGFRYGRYTVIDVVGSDAHVLCDCGNIRFTTKSNLTIGQTRSCGCLRVDVSIEKGFADSKAQSTQCWQQGKWDREKARKQALSLVEQQKGALARGRGAKGEGHHGVKWYAVRSPDGVVLEGLNLSHLVRQNAHLFSADDTAIRVNQWGTEIDCKAMRGLRILFANPSKRAKVRSWKGWTAIGYGDGKHDKQSSRTVTTGSDSCGGNEGDPCQPSIPPQA